jgi:recombination protein RecR
MPASWLTGPSERDGYALAVLTPAVENLVTQLTKLPGIGRRTAQRLAFHILSTRPEDALELARAIEDVKSRVRFCGECGNLTEEELCSVCADPRRDRSVICVVEDPRDIVAIERTREYNGLYHVLHGAISPMDGVGPEDLHMKELVSRVAAGGVTEVIMGTNPSVEGEATALYVARLLKPFGVRVTRLAYGIPVGGSLEYADQMTLLRALEGRRDI